MHLCGVPSIRTWSGAILIAACFACSSQEGSAVDAMLADLRLLLDAQETAAAEPMGALLPSGVAIAENPLGGYAPSPGVTVTLAQPETGGWAAIATHIDAPGRICGVFVGDTPPGGRNPASASGEVECN
jgi:hypothetical protein